MSAGSTPAATLAARARQRQEQTDAVGKFSAASWICLAYTVLGPAVGVTCLSIQSSSNTPSAIGAVLIFAAVFTLVKVLWDLTKPNVSRRNTPADAVSAYLRALRMGWWAGAWACLSGDARSGGLARRPSITLLAIDPESAQLNRPADLKSVWRDFVSGGRRITRVEVRGTHQEGEDLATVTMDLELQFNVNRAPYGSKAREGVGLLDKGFTNVALTGSWPVYCRDGRWYVLDAGLPADIRSARTDLV